jgi:hypothetical protein
MYELSHEKIIYYPIMQWLHVVFAVSFCLCFFFQLHACVSLMLQFIPLIVPINSVGSTVV